MQRANQITTVAKAANGSTTEATTKSVAANGTNTTLGSNTTTAATALNATTTGTTAHPTITGTTTTPKINHALKPKEDGKNGTLERNITFCVSCCPLPTVGRRVSNLYTEMFCHF